jgi:hypothetical protein
MLPRPASGNSHDCEPAHSEVSGYGGHRVSSGETVFGHPGGVYGQLSAGARQVLVAALLLSVAHVVGLGSQEQVFGVNAEPIVAVVADDLSGNWADAGVDGPRDPMRADALSVAPDAPVAVWHLVSGPVPAFVRAGDTYARPEAIGQGPSSRSLRVHPCGPVAATTESRLRLDPPLPLKDNAAPIAREVG